MRIVVTEVAIAMNTELRRSTLNHISGISSLIITSRILTQARVTRVSSSTESASSVLVQGQEHSIAVNDNQNFV